MKSRSSKNELPSELKSLTTEQRAISESFTRRQTQAKPYASLIIALDEILQIVDTRVTRRMQRWLTKFFAFKTMI